MAQTIQLPDNAPFTSEQRAWLGAFLTEMLSQQGVSKANVPSLPVTILFGSQTGNAENLAKKLSKQLQKLSFQAQVYDLAQYDRNRLPNEKVVLVITSTYGDGEPPDNAAEFYHWFMSDAAARLDGVKFSVLSLGDSSYPDFCKCGTDIDSRFEALGAVRIADRVDCDVDTDEPYARWSAAVIAALGSTTAQEEEQTEEESSAYSKQNPFLATSLANYNLNQGGDKQTHHIAFSLEQSGLTYEVGDALGVMPVNSSVIVDEILKNLPFTPGMVPSPKGKEITLRDALMYYYDIGTINKSFIQKWQARSGSPRLRSLVEADDKKAWDDFCWGRDLIDLVVDHPADFSDSEDFVSVLKKLQPRLYSIASSPKAHEGEVHLCVGIVRYQSYGRQRGGICSTFLADRLKSGEKAGVYVHSNNAFRLPEKTDAPVIMVGPGTGIAPFRAFLEERKITAPQGKNWLFFGNPHEKTDFLYRDELEVFMQEGVLTRLDVAWSRDQKEKIYVQDLMVQQGILLWQWLQEGAAFYVCGDASRMAKDVDKALHQVAETHGKLSSEEAIEYVNQLKKDKRYLRDVY